MADVATSTAGLTREISRALVGLTKQYMGRGPTRARTYIRDNLIVCLLEDGMTVPERNLLDAGKSDEVQDLRAAVQDAFADEVVPAIERLTGRRVISFMSDHDLDRDIAAELFVLEPVPGDEPDAASDGAG